MKKDNIIIFIIGIFFLIFILLVGATDFNLFSVATDSGFDTSYDGGGYSGGYSSSGYGSGGIGIFYIIMFIYRYPFFALIIAIITYLIIGHIKEQRRYYNNDLNYTFIDDKYKYSIEIDKELLKQIYKIYYDVQIAWMNFDYDRLRELVSDELYNMYYNELESLRVKGYKNILEGFRIKKISLVSKKEKNGIIEHCINLNVCFYDYIVDQNGHVVRGNKRKYNSMTYFLTVARDTKEKNNCPNCHAPLLEQTICRYCGTYIRSLSNMKLLRKVNIKQERVYKM